MAVEDDVVVNKDAIKGDVPSKQELLGLIDDGESGEETTELSGPELSEREQLAVSQGWMPEEDWIEKGGDPKGWRPADQWLDRGEFFRTINGLKQEVVKSQAMVAEAFKQGQAMEKAKLTDEINELKAERKEARQQGDFEKADQLDEKLDELKEKSTAAAPVVPKGAVPPPPEFDLFKQRNSWYGTDSALHYAADGIGYEYMRINPRATPADLYWHVEQVMQQRFPELKGKRSATLPPSPSASGATSKSNSATGAKGLSKVESEMSDMERDIMKTLIKTGTFKNKEEYLKEFAAAPRRTR